MKAVAATPVAMADTLDVDIAVHGGDWPDETVLDALVADAIAAALPVLADMPGHDDIAGELSVLFTDDAEIRALNARFRAIDKATNVLSFPAPAEPGPVRALGDIVLAQETMSREADDRGLTLEHHITHLLVHGFLHLLGFDHVEDGEAETMERTETAILARLGIADPYADGLTVDD